MPARPHTEDTPVQQTRAAYLAEQLGWESLCAHSDEDFGPGSLLGHGSELSLLLPRLIHGEIRV